MAEEKLIPMELLCPTKDFIFRDRYESVARNIDNIGKIIVAEDITSGVYFIRDGHHRAYKRFELNQDKVLVETEPIPIEELNDYYFANHGTKISDLRILD